MDRYWLLIVFAIMTLSLIGSNLAWYIRYSDQDKRFNEAIESIKAIRKVSEDCLNNQGIAVIQPDPEGQGIVGACMKLEFKLNSK